MIDLEKEVSKLDHQICDLIIKRNELSAKLLMTSSDSKEFIELTNEYASIKNRIDAINRQAVFIKNKVRIREEDAIKAQGEKERKRKQNLATKIMSTTVHCPDCDSPLIWEGPKFDLPIYETFDARNERNGWGRWWLDCFCSKRLRCGFRRTVFPDKPDVNEDRTLQKRKKSLGDNLPVTVVS